jgi:hypothetical protein
MATTNSSCRFTALASGKEVQQPKLLFPHGSALIDTPMIPNSCFCMYVIYIYMLFDHILKLSATSNLPGFLVITAGR